VLIKSFIESFSHSRSITKPEHYQSNLDEPESFCTMTRRRARQQRLLLIRPAWPIPLLLLMVTAVVELSHHGLISVFPVVLALTNPATLQPQQTGLAPRADISFDRLLGQRILVGGSGRVGGSVTTQLVSHGAVVTVGGTQRQSFVDARQRWIQQFPKFDEALQKVSFVELDREQPDSILRVLLREQHQRQIAATALQDDVDVVVEANRPDASTRSSTDESTVAAGATAAAVAAAIEAQFDLVVHTAGPFQGKAHTCNGVLQASIQAGIPYLDVCDDYETATAARTQYSALATEQKVPCIVSTGCWPGVSSLMAQQLVTRAQMAHPHIVPERDLSLRYSFFTAGSGGAGVTLLVATFLILAEPALQIVRGQRQSVPPMQEYTTVDFGRIVGQRDVAHLNLLETASIHETLGVGSTVSLFGTAPNIWNALLGVMAKLPSAVLANEDVMRRLSIFSMPIVRVVDFLAGATNAMRCDLIYRDGRSGSDMDVASQQDGAQQPSSAASASSWTATAIYGHDNLEPCVGECVAAFCCALLTAGRVRPGVWFPEEALDVASGDVLAVLQLAAVRAHTQTVQTKDGTVHSWKDHPQQWG
jgi:saccharopine dehydrogenase-like NADP-dependent oxidoreductase